MSNLSSISKRTLQRAKTSWLQSQEDYKMAKECVKSQIAKSAMLSSQSAVNALASILEASGGFQLPTFSAVELLNACIEYETKLLEQSGKPSTLEELRAVCYLLDECIERDAFGIKKTLPTFTPDFAKSLLRATKKVQTTIGKFWKTHENYWDSLTVD